MSNLGLTTDRKQQDVRDGNPKGYYNYMDLNRVEAATRYIADLLTGHGYPVTIQTKTDWKVTDFPTQAEMERYLNNVKLCVNQFCKMPTTPDLPISMDSLDWGGANTIEKTLEDIDILIPYMLAVLRGCGTFYAGSMEGLRGYVL